jgi:transcriptional regulator GlxA family with amidase domain
MDLERITIMGPNGELPGGTRIVAGTNPKLLTQSQWRELARRAGFQVEALAALREVSLSVRSLERLFERNFHLPPTRFLTQCWVEEARDYIIRTGASNKEVVHKFGFWDEAHLCHLFKRVLSRTPQSFFQETMRAQQDLEEFSIVTLPPDSDSNSTKN